MKLIYDITNAVFELENIRLKLGKSFGKFLLKNKNRLIGKLKKIFASPTSTFYICVLIILTSLFRRSQVDIGHDSALYLEIARKILDGKKYYQDFFEYNFPLSFIFLIIPVYIAKLINISPIIVADYYINFLAILALFCSYKILRKSTKLCNQTDLNLIIIALTLGFFLRPKTLIFNEFLTKSSFFLILALPIISLHILGIEKLKLIPKVILGILYACLVFIKPNFIILIAFLEIFRVYNSRNFKNLFDAHLAVFIIFIATHLLALKLYFPSFIDNFDYMIKLYNEYKNKLFLGYKVSPIFALFKFFIDINLRQFIFYISLIVLYSRILKKDELLRYFLLVGLAVYSIAITESYYLDQLVVFYCLFAPLVALGFVRYISQYTIHFDRRWFIYTGIAIFCLFSIENTGYLHAGLFFELSPILTLYVIFALLFHDKFQRYKFWFVSCLVILSILLIFYNLMILDLLCVAILLWILSKNYRHKNLSSFISIIIIIATFTFAGNFFKTIMGNLIDREAYFEAIKSPNSRNNELIKIAKNYLKNQQNMIIIAKDIYRSYPFRNYLELTNNSEFSHYDIMYDTLHHANIHRINQRFEDKVQASFLKNINDHNNNIIVFFDLNPCSIGYLEYLLRNPDIRNYFVNNFKYLSNFSDTQINQDFVPEPLRLGLNDNEYQIVKQFQDSQKSDLKIIKNDIFEAYIRQ